MPDHKMQTPAEVAVENMNLKEDLLEDRADRITDRSKTTIEDSIRSIGTHIENSVRHDKQLNHVTNEGERPVFRVDGTFKREGKQIAYQCFITVFD